MLFESREVFGWGSGWKGKLGLGDDLNHLTPTPLPSLRRKHITQLRCGSFHTVALTEQGEVFTWGIGERGQLGHGDLENRKSYNPNPRLLPSLLTPSLTQSVDRAVALTLICSPKPISGTSFDIS